MQRSSKPDWAYVTIFVGLAVYLAAWLPHGGWYWLLAWPMTSLLLVGLAYGTGTASLFGKRRTGERFWPAAVALGPYLFALYTIWRIQALLSSEPAVHAVNDRLYVARRLRGAELPSDVRQVCDLTCEFTDPSRIRSAVNYVCYPILDAGSTGAAELVEFVKTLPPLPEGRLLIHCANGHGRTAMVAAVWLLVHGYAATADEAVRMIQAVRQAAKMRRRQWETVHQTS